LIFFIGSDKGIPYEEGGEGKNQCRPQEEESVDGLFAHDILVNGIK